MFRDYKTSNNDGVNWTGESLSLSLNDVQPCVSGPKRPHDKIPLVNLQKDFKKCIENSKNDFKGFGIPKEEINKEIQFKYKGKEYTLK